MAGKVAERAEALVARWDAQADAADGDSSGSIVVEIDDAAQAVTMEVMHEALFSEQLDVIARDPAALALKHSFRQFLAGQQNMLADFFKTYEWFATSAMKQRETNQGHMDAHFDERADARRATIAAAAAAAAAAPGGAAAADAVDVPQDLLTALLSARDPETGAALSRDEVNLTLREMMVAGQDTTAATVACLLCMLAAHPEALRVVVAEVDAVVAGAGGRLPATMAEVAQLTVRPGTCRSSTPRHRMPYES